MVRELDVGGALAIANGAYLDLLHPSDTTNADISVLGYINNAGTVTASANIDFSSNIANVNQWFVGDGQGRPTASVMTSDTFTQISGTLSFNDNSGLYMYGGGFNFIGGSIPGSASFNADGSRPSSGGTILLIGSSLATSTADGGGATFNSVTDLHLTTDFAPNTWLYVFGISGHGSAQLYVNSNFNNNGTIVLRANDGFDTSVQAGDGNGIFTNRGTLVLTTNTLTGTTHFTGVLVNYGTVNTYATLNLGRNVANEASFNLGEGYTINMTDARFNQDAGNLGNFGDTHLDITNGAFNFNGGAVYLTVDLHNSSLGVYVADGQGVAFNAWSGVYLKSNLPVNTTLTSFADANGSTKIYAPDNAVNYGSIVLAQMMVPLRAFRQVMALRLSTTTVTSRFSITPPPVSPTFWDRSSTTAPFS